MNVDLIRKYAETTERKRRMESELREIAKELDADEELVIREIASAGVRNVPVLLSDGRTATVYVQRIVRARPGEGGKEAVVEAIKAIPDIAELVAEGYNTQTLDAAVRERLASGDPLWPELAQAIEINEVERAGVQFETGRESSSARASRAIRGGARA